MASKRDPQPYETSARVNGRRKQRGNNSMTTTQGLVAQALAIAQDHAPARPGIAQAAQRRVADLERRIHEAEASAASPRSEQIVLMLQAQLRHIVSELQFLPVVHLRARVNNYAGHGTSPQDRHQ